MAPTLKSKKSLIKSKSKDKESEDVTWVLEGIVGYLQSPAWTAPTMNFIDENCGCFDNAEENKLEYTDIHVKYKALVEELLAQYIKELNISEDLFAQACDQHNSSIKRIEGMFEYIWAGDDFMLFKRLMSKHNLELEMQAISYLQAKDAENRKQSFGDNPPFNPKFMLASSELLKEPSSSNVEHMGKSGFENSDILTEILNESHEEYASTQRRENQLEEKEASDLKRAIEFSRQEMERLNVQAEEERRMLEEAIRQSLQCSSPTIEVDCSTIQTASTSNHTAVTKELTLGNGVSPSHKKKMQPQKEHSTKSATHQPLPPLRQKTNAEAASDWIASAQQETGTVISPQPSFTNMNKEKMLISKQTPAIDPADLEKRREYLKGQREKLLELKRQKRDAELKRYQDAAAGSGTSSSKQVKEKEPIPESSNSDGDKALNARRALAERLKREVVHKTN